MIDYVSIPGAKVARELDASFRLNGKPIQRLPSRYSVFSDNGTEFASWPILELANDSNAEWHCIDLGKQRQNAFFGSFNGSLRDELLYVELFDGVDDAMKAGDLAP